MFDVVFSSLALLVLFPLLLLIAGAVYLEGGRPVIFCQERWGLNQRVLKILKFRTMHRDLCDSAGRCQVVPGDTRVTQLGRFLRKTNLDELPQLFNVLKGDMSIVGPRCHPIEMLAAGMPYEQVVPEYHLRHLVKPGMTGLAQVSGYRGPTVSLEAARQRIAYDLVYIGSFGLLLDLKIIARTIALELRGGTGL